MKRQIICNAFCPTLNKDFQITVDYLDTSTFDSPNRYIQNGITCEYASYVENHCPNQKECPLLKQAPKVRAF